MGGCQNYGPFLGTLNNRCRIIIGNQKGTSILTATHIYIYRGQIIRMGLKRWLPCPQSHRPFQSHPRTLEHHVRTDRIYDIWCSCEAPLPPKPWFPPCSSLWCGSPPAPPPLWSWLAAPPSTTIAYWASGCVGLGLSI